MPLASIAADQAMHNVRRLRASVWPDDRVPGDRLKGVAKVEARPSFTFSKSDRILTLGSCFAREIEERLDRFGFDVPLFHVETLPEDRTSKRHDDVANKFTIQSIENELRWAAGEAAPPPEKLFLETTDGLWHDAQLFHLATPLPIERVAERRALFQKSMREFPACRVVIITLGLVEAWFDEETSLYLNATPPPACLRRYPGRFRLDVLSYADILGSMERIFSLLREKGHPDLRLLVTVSPVPLKATFSGEDAISANAYSKAVQRAACREFVERHAEADYFPSYEIVTQTSRELAYERDNLHVNKSVVDQIMFEVMAAYAPEIHIRQRSANVPLTRQTDQLLRPTDMFRLIKHHLGEGELAEAERACLEGLQRFEGRMTAKDEGVLRYLHGVTLAEQARWAEASDELQASIALEPGDGISAYRLGQCWMKLRRWDQAVTAYEQAAARDSSRPEFGQALERAKARARAARMVWPLNLVAAKALAKAGL